MVSFGFYLSIKRLIFGFSFGFFDDSTLLVDFLSTILSSGLLLVLFAEHLSTSCLTFGFLVVIFEDSMLLVDLLSAHFIGFSVLDILSTTGVIPGDVLGVMSFFSSSLLGTFCILGEMSISAGILFVDNLSTSVVVLCGEPGAP